MRPFGPRGCCTQSPDGPGPAWAGLPLPAQKFILVLLEHCRTAAHWTRPISGRDDIGQDHGRSTRRRYDRTRSTRTQRCPQPSPHHWCRYASCRRLNGTAATAAAAAARHTCQRASSYSFAGITGLALAQGLSKVRACSAGAMSAGGRCSQPRVAGP